MENAAEYAENKDYLPGDPELIDKIVFQLKLQGLFDEFRKECLADVDTKPAYQNLRQRVDSSVASFLNGITWSPSLNKKTVRENLRKHVYDCRYLDQGVERIVQQVVNPKICSVFMPKVEEVVYQFLGIKVEPKSEAETLTISNKWSSGIDKVKAGRDSKHGFSNIKGEQFNLLPGELEPISPDHDEFSDNEGGGKTSRKSTKTLKIKEEAKDTNDEELSPLKTESEIKKEKVDDDTSPAFEPHHPRKDGDNSADSELSGISDLTSLGSPKQNNSSDNNESARNESVNDEIQAVSELVSQDKTFDQDESEPMIDASAISPLTSSSVGSGDSPREKIVYDEQMFDEICASYSAQDNNDDRFNDDKSSDSDGSDLLRINDSPLFEKKNFNVESIQSSDDEEKSEKDFGKTANDFDFLKENSNFIKDDDNREESSDLEKKPEVRQDETENQRNDNVEHSVNTDSNSVMAEFSHDQLEDSEDLSFPKTPTIHYENSSGSAEFESVGELKEKIKKNQEKSLTLEENSVASFEDCLLKTGSIKDSQQNDESSLSLNKQTEESNVSIETDNNSITSVKDSNFSGKINSKSETSKLYEHNSKEKERKHSHHSHKSSPSSRKDSSSSSREHRRSYSSKSSSKDGRDTPSSKDGKESKSSKDSKDHSSVKDLKDSKHSKDSKEHKSSKDSKEVKVLKDGKEPKLSKDSKPAKEHSSPQDVKEDPVPKEKLEEVSSKDAKAHPSSKEREKLKESKSHSSSMRENKDSSRHSSKYHRSKESSSKDSSSTSSDKSSKDHHRSSSKDSHHSDKTKSLKETEKKNHSSKDASKDKYEATKKTDDYSKKSSEKSKDHKKPDKIHKDRKRKEHCSSMANDRESRRSSDRDNDGSSSNTSHHHSKSTHQFNSTSEAPRGEEPPKKSHKSSHKQANNSSNSSESNADHSQTKKTYIIFPVLKNPLPVIPSINPSALNNVCVSHKNNSSKTENYPVSGKSQSSGSAESNNHLFKVGNELKNSLVIFDKVPKIILERCSLDAFKHGLSNDASKTVSASASKSTTSQVNNDESIPKKKSHLESSKCSCDETEKQTATNLIDESSDDDNVIMDPEYLAKINAAVLPSDSSVCKISKKPKIAANIAQVRDKIKKRKMFRSLNSTEIDEEDVIMDPEYLAKINAANFKTENAQKNESTIFEVTAKPTVIKNNLLVLDAIDEQNIADNNLKRKREENSNSHNFEFKKGKQSEKEKLSTVVGNPIVTEKTDSDTFVSPVNTPQEDKFESGRYPPMALESSTTERSSPSSFRESSCDETRDGAQETEITTSQCTVDNISSLKNRIGDQTVRELTATERSVDLSCEDLNKSDPSDLLIQSNCEKLVKSNSEYVSTPINSEEIKESNPSGLVAQLSSDEVTKADPSSILPQSSSEESMKSDPEDSLTQLNSKEIMRSLLQDLVMQVSNEESMKSDFKDGLTQSNSDEVTKSDPLSILTQVNSKDLIKSDAENALSLLSKNEITKLDPSDCLTQLNSKNSIKLDPEDEVSQSNSEEIIKPDLNAAWKHLSMEESIKSNTEDIVTQLSDEEIKESDPKDLLTKLRSFIVSKFKSHRIDEGKYLEPNCNLLNFINSQFLNYVNNFEEQLRNDLKMMKINFTTDYFNFDSSLDCVLRNDYHFEVDRKSYVNVPEINSSDYSYDENSDCYILNKNSSSTVTVSPPIVISTQRKGSNYASDGNSLQSNAKPKKIKICGLSTGELQVSHRSFCSPESLSLDHKLIGGSDQSSQEETVTTQDSETLSPSKSSILNTSDLSKDLLMVNQLNDSVVSPKYDGDCSTDDSSIPNTPSKSLTAQLIEPALESLLAESGLSSLQSSEDHSRLKKSNRKVQDAIFSPPLTLESDLVSTDVSPQKSNNNNNNNNHNKRHSGENNVSAKRKPSPINDKNVPPVKQRYALVESSLGKLQRYDSSDLYKPRPLFSQTSRRSRNNNSNDRDSIGVENESDNPLNTGVIGKKR